MRVLCTSFAGGGLGHFLPLVSIPLGADMPDAAPPCAALGVGRTLLPESCTAEAVRDHVRALLADPAYRANAAQQRDATAALPGQEDAVALLERLMVEKQPILVEL